MYKLQLYLEISMYELKSKDSKENAKLDKSEISDHWLHSCFIQFMSMEEVM
jgi:hypothetical protein